MNNALSYASSVTPRPGNEWTQKSDAERMAAIQYALDTSGCSSSQLLVVTMTKPDGQVIVKFKESVGADRRGTLLLDTEELLKKTVDQGLTIWLEAMGDRNSLRRLRGIEVKS